MEAARESRSALNEVLARLGDRVSPVSMARERIIPVAEPLGGVFADGGIVRGWVVSCRGPASSSLAFSLASAAMAEGAWLAVVDVGGFGVDAAAELGLPLERVVRISTAAVDDPSASPEAQVADWIDVVGAAADGFDLVLARTPPALGRLRPPAALRKLSARLQQRGAVVITLGDVGALSHDVSVTSASPVWSGLGTGVGRLRGRRVEVEAVGRRQPIARRRSVEFVGAERRVTLGLVEDGREARPEVGEIDPQEQVLAEMRTELASRRGPDADPGRREAG